MYSSVEEYVRDFGGDVDRIGHPDGNFWVSLRRTTRLLRGKSAPAPGIGE